MTEGLPAGHGGDRPVRVAWLGAAVGATGILTVAWACLTEWGGVLHGHPAYAAALGLTVVVSALALARTLRRRARRGGWRAAARIALALLGLGGIAFLAWARPHTAVEPALTAMQTDHAVVVTESATRIVLAPAAGGDALGVLFQPGALVDPRAYAAVLRPLAEAGHTVVIAKQPFGIAFLATGALEDARTAFPGIHGWVVAGHSLGGTVAALEADAADEDPVAPAIGLLLYASYPAGDISGSLKAPAMSISGSRDGLATPERITASKIDLPPGTEFVRIDGASHAQFGAYGAQSGDNSPQISNEDARVQISQASLRFVTNLQP